MNERPCLVHKIDLIWLSGLARIQNIEGFFYRVSSWVFLHPH